MHAEPFVSRVLDDEGLSDGLNEAEAQRLVAWLVNRVEAIAGAAASEADAWKQVERLCQRARAIRRLVILACYDHDRAGAAQLAQKEGVPLPSVDDPEVFLEELLDTMTG